MQHKKIGIGYFILSITYLVVIAVLIGIISGYKNITIETVFSDIAIIQSTLIQLFILFSINIFLGVYAFRFEKITHQFRKIIVILSAIVSIFVITSLILNLYSIFIDNPQDWYSWYYAVPSILMAGLYSFYTVRLAQIAQKIGLENKRL